MKNILSIISQWFFKGPFLPFESFEGLSGFGGLFLIGLITFFSAITFNKKWRSIFF